MLGRRKVGKTGPAGLGGVSLLLPNMAVGGRRAGKLGAPGAVR